VDNNFLKVYKNLIALQYSSFSFILDNSVKLNYEESFVFHLIAILATVFFFLQSSVLWSQETGKLCSLIPTSQQMVLQVHKHELQHVPKLMCELLKHIT